MSENKKWKTVISPRGKYVYLNIKEIWSYRDLILLFVKREFTSKYKQTVLGPLWAVIQPLLTTVVFTIIFGSLAKLTTADAEFASTTQIPSFLFYMSGTVVWTYFAATITTTSNTFIANMNVMGKVYYPRMCTPIASSISHLISFGIQFVLMVIISGVFMITGSASFWPSKHILIIPALILQMMALSIGVGVIISALTTKYRDLTMLVNFGLELWKYATPVAYGLLLIPGKWLGLYMLNPITPIVTTMRYAMFGVGYFDMRDYAVSLAVTMILFLIGLVLFNRVEKTFMDTI